MFRILHQNEHLIFKNNDYLLIASVELQPFKTITVCVDVLQYFIKLNT